MVTLGVVTTTTTLTTTTTTASTTAMLTAILIMTSAGDDAMINDDGDDGDGFNPRCSLGLDEPLIRWVSAVYQSLISGAFIGVDTFRANDTASWNFKPSRTEV